MTQTTYPDNTTTQYTYDFRNNVINMTDQAGHVMHNVYDLAGRLTSTTMAYGTADATTTSYTYYNDGRKATETDPGGNTTTYNYDPAGRLTSVVDAQQHTTAYAYDDAGNQTSATDANGHKTQQQYDARRRLQKTTYDDGTTTQYAYDGPGNLTGVTDQAGNVVQYTYDFANQLKSVIQTASPNPQNATAYAYDPNGNLTNLTDANSHTTQHGLDLLNQLNKETLPLGQTQTRTYDAAGNLLTLTDYNGHTTTYTYDSQNRLLSKIPDPAVNEPTVSFTYTATGKRASMTDASGTTTYTYDSLDRLKTKATPQGTLSYTYDAAGNVASIQSSNTNGTSVAYTYDNLNRLSTVVDNRLPAGQNTTTYTYDPASNLAMVAYPNGLYSTFNYDDLNRLKLLNDAKGSYSYSLGPTGNRLSATESSVRTVNWTYDGIYRLTNETISLDPHSNNGSVAYNLDGVGNRLSQTSSLPGISSGTFTFDPNDRLSTETYDNNGNTLRSGGKTFAYDFENRVKSMNSGAVSIVYDGDGNRVAKTVNGVTTRYLVDDFNPTSYAQVAEEVVNGLVQRVYTYGLARISQNQFIANNWTVGFFGYDGVDGGGTVRLIADMSGTVTDTYDYDAWGNVVGQTGSTPNVMLYRGEQYDPDLGFYYLRARYMNPLTGRFLSPDPLPAEPDDPATLHRYLYVGGNPVNRFDPSGWQSQEPSGGGGGAITPEAGGYIHISIGPLQWPVIDLSKARYQVDHWRDPSDPRCWPTPGGQGRQGGARASGASGVGSSGGVKICSRAGWQDLGPGGVANHVYLWDPGRCLVCGQGNDSYAGNENPHAPGTVCIDIPGSNAPGAAQRIMGCCSANGGPSRQFVPGSFGPRYGDCHGLVDVCIQAAGLVPPPHPGASKCNFNGRFGSRCPYPSCQWGPWGPGHPPDPFPIRWPQ